MRRTGPMFFHFTMIALACAVCWNAASAAETKGAALEKLDPNMAVADPGGEWAWYDALLLGREGKGWEDTEDCYDRLPNKAKGVVPDAVWSLSKHSAGMCVQFVTNAAKIGARWEVVSDSLAMPHMPATGVSGLDLYVRMDGGWRWIGNGRPENKTTQAVLTANLPEGEHEYRVYLPLYNGTKSLEIGVPPEASLSKAPPRSPEKSRPIVFYGTSITHGGCASRPGMAYPAILGRRMDMPVINLGFSGNGKMDAPLATLLGELDAAAYVIDCAPNMSAEMISERAVPFVTSLRSLRPDVPIILVENIHHQADAFLEGHRQAYREKNDVLRKCYEQLVSGNAGKLFYIPGEDLLGHDGESTVDGVHPNDLGFARMADAMEPVLKTALYGSIAAP